MKVVLYDADEDRSVKDLKLDDQVPIQSSHPLH